MVSNYVLRTIFTFFMVGIFAFLIYAGPIALMFIVLAIQVKCFQEIIAIGYSVYRIHGLKWFRSLSWYFLMATNYFIYGESLVDYFVIIIRRAHFLSFLIGYHRFISFCLYIVGFVWFVLSLEKRYYMRQFSLFAWTHVTLLIFVTQSYLQIQNLFEGLIWFIVPVSMIICNDIMAYIFGSICGRTPLIKLSPKKTWEGFIGGGLATIVLGAVVSTQTNTTSLNLNSSYNLFNLLKNLEQLSHYMCQYTYFTCPIDYSKGLSRQDIKCEPSMIFVLTEYTILPEDWAYALELLYLTKIPTTVYTYPFVWHSLSLSLFSSILGPFGGFFASGFKRAFKIKDFSDTIPGHGGIVDRFDCQFLMATFTNVYISSFIKAPKYEKLFQYYLLLPLEAKLKLFQDITEDLTDSGILEPLGTNYPTLLDTMPPVGQ